MKDSQLCLICSTVMFAPYVGEISGLLLGLLWFAMCLLYERLEKRRA